MKPKRKRFSQLYWDIYGVVCGTGTQLNILHFQFLAVYKLFPETKKLLGERSGSVFDFGCGTKPYKTWFKSTTEYVGADLIHTEDVDIQIIGGKIPPINKKFDYVLATQVFEHTEHLDYIGQLYDILKPEGEIIIAVPFLYQVHDEYDFRRFTLAGIERVLLDAGFETVCKKPMGGVGSTMGILFLGFWDVWFSQNKLTKVFKMLLLPVFMLMTFIVNCWSILVDKLDKTNRFYNNQIIIAKKP